MKWIALMVFAFVLFLIFRRMNREQGAGELPGEFTQPGAPPPGNATQFALRAPMSFDDFYSRYYASENINREFVMKVLAYVAHAGGVPAEQLRPEDRLDALPKRSAYVGMKMVEKMVGKALNLGAVEHSGPIPETHLDTLDNVIRLLEPHHVELLKSQVFHSLGTEPHS
jgi:hypothetical protein